MDSAHDLMKNLCFGRIYHKIGLYQKAKLEYYLAKDILL